MVWGGAGPALYAHQVTCEQMAAAALDPQARADIVALLHTPSNISAVMRLMQLCACQDLTVATAALACTHNVLWPHNFASLPLATTLLCVNRVPASTSLVSTLARERSPARLKPLTFTRGGGLPRSWWMCERSPHTSSRACCRRSSPLPTMHAGRCVSLKQTCLPTLLGRLPPSLAGSATILTKGGDDVWRGTRQVAAQAGAVLRYLLCVQHDTWNKMHVEVVSTMAVALGSLIRSDDPHLFAEAVRACAWLHDSNPQTLHRFVWRATRARLRPRTLAVPADAALLSLTGVRVLIGAQDCVRHQHRPSGVRLPRHRVGYRAQDLGAAFARGTRRAPAWG